MWATLMMLVQDVAASPSATIDLLAPIRPLRCPESKTGDIVVCGQRPGDEQRLFERTTDADDQRLPRAEARLFGNTRGSVEVESATIAPGIQSDRLMFRLKTPF